MRTLRRKYILLGAIALLFGALTPMAVTASEYDRIGAVAQGVYHVQADDDRFRIEAEEATEALVYAPNGDLIVARHIDAGAEHDFIVNDGRAIVALFEGEAVVKATGDGTVEKLETQTERIELVEADGESVDRTVTVQLPDMLVGVGGDIEGNADNLFVEATTEEGTVFRVSQDGVERRADALAKDALREGVLDVDVQADSLDGVIIVTLSTVEVPDAEQIEEPVENTTEDTSGIPIHNASGVPYQIDADEGATLNFDVDGGYMLDASLYAENGSQVFYTHRGPAIEEARNYCQDATDCQPWSYNEGDGVAPENITTELAPGTYTLFVRAGHVEGLLTLEDPEGTDLIAEAEELELTHIEAYSDEEYDLETPVLDIWHEDWSVDAFKNLEVTIEDEVAYEYRSTASAGGLTVDSDRSYDPSVLQAGNVVIDFDGLTQSSGGQEGLWLVTFE